MVMFRFTDIISQIHKNIYIQKAVTIVSLNRPLVPAFHRNPWKGTFETLQSFDPNGVFVMRTYIYIYLIIRL